MYERSIMSIISLVYLVALSSDILNVKSIYIYITDSIHNVINYSHSFYKNIHVICCGFISLLDALNNASFALTFKVLYSLRNII